MEHHTSAAPFGDPALGPARRLLVELGASCPRSCTPDGGLGMLLIYKPFHTFTSAFYYGRMAGLGYLGLAVEDSVSSSRGL
jgi:hypothetical protein